MERRPIASRNTRWADACASALAKTGMTPNTISVLGMVSALLAGICYFLTRSEYLVPATWWILGAVLVQLRLLANLFDGMVAMIQNATSPVGELYNEIPDRVSDAVILIGFGYALSSSPTLGLIAAALALFVAYLRAQMAVSGAPQQYVGPMAKAHRMAVITVASIASAAFSQFPVPIWALWVVIGGCIITSIRRLIRGSRHLIQPSAKPPFDV